MIIRGDSVLTIPTFVGGRINAMLAAILDGSKAVSVRSFGDCNLRVEGPTGDAPSADDVRAALVSVRDVDKRLAAVDKAAFVSEKVRGSLAKFQPYLPPDLEGAYLAERLFDCQSGSRPNLRLITRRGHGERAGVDRRSSPAEG